MVDEQKKQPSEIAMRIKERRLELSMSAREVDKRSGLAMGHTALIERGDRQAPTIQTVLSIAAALEVNPTWLMTGKENWAWSQDSAKS